MKTILEAVRLVVNSNSVDFKDKAKLAATLAAEALAAQVPIPTEAIGETAGFFRTNHKVAVMVALSKVNEFIVLDLDQTCDLVYHMWNIRYSIVHTPNDPAIARLTSLMFAGNGSHIPNIYREVAAKYPKLYFSRWDLEEINKEL